MQLAADGGLRGNVSGTMDALLLRFLMPDWEPAGRATGVVEILGTTAAPLFEGLSLFIGDGFESFMAGSIDGLIHGGEHGTPLDLAVDIFTDPLTYLTLALAVVGILLAWKVYYVPGFDRSIFARGVNGRMQRALENRLYISKFYDDLAVKVVYGLSLVADAFDRYVIDGAVNGFAFLGGNTGGLIRRLQNGNVRRYAGLIVAGVCALLILVMYVLPWGGW